VDRHSRSADDVGQFFADRHRVVDLGVMGASMWETLDAGHSVTAQTRTPAAARTRAVRGSSSLFPDTYREHRLRLAARGHDRLTRPVVAEALHRICPQIHR
jgi:hypothetical protein